MNAPFEMSEQMNAGMAALLENVRTLDKAARQRLAQMLENEWDMQILDLADREISRSMTAVGGLQVGSALRSRYVSRVMQGREYMVDEMRGVMSKCDAMEEEDIELAS